MNSPQAGPSQSLTRQSRYGDGAPKRKLLDRVRDVCRLKHYSLCTEQAYVYWIKKYILYSHKRYLLMMGNVKHARGARRDVHVIIAHERHMKRQRFLDKLGMTNGGAAGLSPSITLRINSAEGCFDCAVGINSPRLVRLG
jgi:hypothetical protein